MKDSLLNINLKVANKTIVEKESRDASIIYDISNDSKTSVEALIKLSDKLDLKNRDLSCANFSGSKFINVYLDNANLQGAYLGWTNLQGAHLWGTNLYDAFLKETNLQGAFLLRANLIVADLTGAYLQGASLTKANLTNANLQGAYLDNATLQVADLDNATLEGASLTGARLNCSTIDKKTNLEGIYYDDINKLFEWHEYSKIDNKTAERCKSLDERSKAYLIKNKKNPNLFLDINKKLSCKNASMALNISHRNISVTFDTGTKVSFRDVITKHIQDNCTQFLQYTK
ncbi:pentapeptide repeat-containing protein [Candidatus Magnetominusculus dajiuhuensis]|uniref:pentapeptide repeat-containing protein n=1 Tax=Candidatus Magnetominusculus dajiuhuensis TaxID=3137712 RepID=UPI003B42A141